MSGNFVCLALHLDYHKVDYRMQSCLPFVAVLWVRTGFQNQLHIVNVYLYLATANYKDDQKREDRTAYSQLTVV